MYWKKYTIILLLSTCLVITKAYCQFNFQQLIGGTGNDRAQTIFNTYDNGYIVNGASLSFGAGNADATLIKTDNQGLVIWSFAYGTIDYDNSEFALETFDRKIVCAGRSNIQAGLPSSAFIFKTDSAGQLLWSKFFGGISDDDLVQIIETSDNGYAAIGYTKSQSSGLSDILLIRTNINGDTLFIKSYGTAEDETGLSIIQLPDNGFVIAGRQRTSTGGQLVADGLLLRTDDSGNLLWTKQYGDLGWEEITSIKLLTDNGYILSGSTSSFNSGNYDILLMKTDSDGNVQWTKTFGGGYTDAGYDIHVNADKSIVISGYTESLGYGHLRGNDSTNIFLMKTSENGELLWMEVYGDGLQDEGYRSAKSNDGGYLISGFTTNYLFNDGTQMLFIKTDSMGLSGCHEMNVTPDDSLITMPVQSVNFNQLSGLPVNTFLFTKTTFTPNEDDACLFSTVNYNINDKKLKVYPNPFSSQIEISFDSPISLNEELQISDICGKIIKSFHIFSSPYLFDTSELARGIYIISLKYFNNSGKSMLVVKN